MSIPFSRSMRSLQADKARLSLFGLIGATILLVAWIAWFLLARMTLYETGELIRMTPEGTLEADFPVTAAGRIQRGQAAILQSETGPGKPASLIPAMVTDVSISNLDQRVRVILYPRTHTTMLNSQSETLAGQARVAVDRISPAELLFGQAELSPSTSRNSFK